MITLVALLTPKKLLIVGAGAVAVLYAVGHHELKPYRLVAATAPQVEGSEPFKVHTASETIKLGWKVVRDQVAKVAKIGRK